MNPNLSICTVAWYETQQPVYFPIILQRKRNIDGFDEYGKVIVGYITWRGFLVVS